MPTISSKIEVKVGDGSFRGSIVTVLLETAVGCSFRNLQTLINVEINVVVETFKH